MSASLTEPSCSKYSLEMNICGRFAKQLLIHLQPLGELLKCPICFEFFNTCMMTKCCHSFCSLCIRKHMSYKSQCPQCFQESTEPELRSNRQIDEVVHIYSKISMYLQSVSENSLNSSNMNCSTFEVPVCSLSTSNRISESRLPLEISISKHSDVPLNNVIKESQLKSDAEMNSDVTPQVPEKVSCPVCSALVLPQRINNHLDQCLDMEENRQSANNQVKRKPLPKVVYHILSDKEIKKRLKENGLSTSGNRQSLIKRHKQFLLLYNSECDKQQPRPVEELVKQVETEERELKNVETTKLFQSDKKSNLASIQEEHDNYLKQNKRQFDALVEDIHKRRSNNRRYKTVVKEESENTNERHNAFSSAISEDLDDSEMLFNSQSPELFDDAPEQKPKIQLQNFATSILDENSEEIALISSQLSTCSSDDFELSQRDKKSQRWLKRKFGGSSSKDDHT